MHLFGRLAIGEPVILAQTPSRLETAKENYASYKRYAIVTGTADSSDNSQESLLMRWMICHDTHELFRLNGLFSFVYFNIFGKLYILCSRSMCNGYHGTKWTPRTEFKFSTRLFAFHIALIQLGKV